MTLAAHFENLRRHVVMIGAGNIGSQAIGHLGRMRNLVGKVTIVDKDTYGSNNLDTQDITPADIGHPKAIVQARRIKEINPRLDVEAIVETVENVPRGRLKADVILAGVDSKAARQYINQLAWRLDVPWIDSGVDGQALYARVNVYCPGEETPCIECAWDDKTYENLPQVFPCMEKAADPTPTNAPTTIGALAASLLVIECSKILLGQREEAAVGKQVLIDARHHKHYVTSFRRNTNCRFDHNVWPIERLNCRPESVMLGEILQTGADTLQDPDVAFVAPEGKRFVTRVKCPSCADSRQVLCLPGRGNLEDQACATCGVAMIPIGFEMMEHLTAGEIPTRFLSLTLSSIGVKPHDVIGFRNGVRTKHYEIVEP
jgi:molybdopterin/thiamine biosynthesis adenylyltransferase